MWSRRFIVVFPVLLFALACGGNPSGPSPTESFGSYYFAYAGYLSGLSTLLLDL